MLVNYLKSLTLPRIVICFFICSLMSDLFFFDLWYDMRTKTINSSGTIELIVGNMILILFSLFVTRKNKYHDWNNMSVGLSIVYTIVILLSVIIGFYLGGYTMEIFRKHDIVPTGDNPPLHLLLVIPIVLLTFTFETARLTDRIIYDFKNKVKKEI